MAHVKCPGNGWLWGWAKHWCGASSRTWSTALGAALVFSMSLPSLPLPLSVSIFLQYLLGLRVSASLPRALAPLGLLAPSPPTPLMSTPWSSDEGAPGSQASCLAGVSHLQIPRLLPGTLSQVGMQVASPDFWFRSLMSVPLLCLETGGKLGASLCASPDQASSLQPLRSSWPQLMGLRAWSSLLATSALLRPHTAQLGCESHSARQS